MELQLLQNTKKSNHLKQMIKMAKKSDTLIIGSPFLSDNMECLIEQMPTIKNVTVYTTLDKFDDTAQKAITLFEFLQYCKKHNVDLIVKIDEELHGKVYLFYEGILPKGFIISSGNFTNNGLEKNHEFGVLIEDSNQQKIMANMIMSMPTYDLSEESLNILNSEAHIYLKNHKQDTKEGFKAKRLIDKKPSVTQNGNQQFYIKPVGTSSEPFEEPKTLGDNDIIGFNNNPKSMNKGDVLICHSVGPSNIIGYYVVSDDKASYNKWNDDDRWPWKIHVECHSGKFSSEWWKYKLKTQDLVSEFLHDNPGKHITAIGTDTIGSLQWGRDKLHISKDFAMFIINRLEEIQGKTKDETQIK
ncbi:phospholipase D family protein [uncultured Clostridium sp.]|uniref:phospholipase D family protein n=1 Tax=uncultured Clostridium sp. TaxID=59620 RepID=UPI0025F8F7CC|nr:phospholipase D family protein [uncultured Clostridium sp.]